MKQEVPVERRQFTREFKLEAVRLVKQRGNTPLETFEFSYGHVSRSIAKSGSR
jgi:transposase-like protein